MKYFILISFILTACAHGPKSERKSKLNYLNGEHYETASGSIVPQNVAIPIGIKRKAKATLIEGSVLYKNGNLATPLNRQKIIIQDKDGKKVAETYSEAGGFFKFNQPIKNGNYNIFISSKKYKGSLNVRLKTYELKGLRLIVMSQ